MTRKNVPPSDEVANKTMIKLAAAGFRFPSHMKPSIASELYLETLKRFPVGAIDAFLAKTWSGEYEFARSGFLPIPPAMASLLNDETTAFRARMTLARKSDKRRMAIWNTLPDHLNNRQREEAIDRVIAELDAAEASF